MLNADVDEGSVGRNLSEPMEIKREMETLSLVFSGECVK